MPMTCARCGDTVTDESRSDITCPRCGAPQPNPAWTLPYSQAGNPTLESNKSDAGSLSRDKKYALVVVNGAEPGRIYPLERARVVIGRAECDLALEDPELSRQHALIAINGTSVRLEDLGSTNGTFVDEERIEAVELVDRSEFRIGAHELLFVMRDREDP